MTGSLDLDHAHLPCRLTHHDPRTYGIDDRKDALRHSVWQGLMTVRMGGNDWLARILGSIYELDGLPDALRDMIRADTMMDLWNNTVAQRAGHTRDENTIVRYCIERARTAHLITRDQATKLDLNRAYDPDDFLVYLKRD